MSDSRTVPARVRHELLALVKESLANVAKHAAAHAVTLHIEVDGTWLRVSLRDDGNGFEPALGNGGSGLENLREHAWALVLDVHHNRYAHVRNSSWEDGMGFTGRSEWSHPATVPPPLRKGGRGS